VELVDYIEVRWLSHQFLSFPDISHAIKVLHYYVYKLLMDALVLYCVVVQNRQREASSIEIIVKLISKSQNHPLEMLGQYHLELFSSFKVFDLSESLNEIHHLTDLLVVVRILRGRCEFGVHLKIEIVVKTSKEQEEPREENIESGVLFHVRDML
jgi:hypothetical protein